MEPGEDPLDTGRREAREELGIDAVLLTPTPDFLTVTPTVGRVEDRHTDVTLWYTGVSSRSDLFARDWAEFSKMRWWTLAEVAAAPAGSLEPHLRRYLAAGSQGHTGREEDG